MTYFHTLISRVIKTARQYMKAIVINLILNVVGGSKTGRPSLIASLKSYIKVARKRALKKRLLL